MGITHQLWGLAYGDQFMDWTVTEFHRFVAEGAPPQLSCMETPNHSQRHRRRQTQNWDLAAKRAQNLTMEPKEVWHILQTVPSMDWRDKGSVTPVKN